MYTVQDSVSQTVDTKLNHLIDSITDINNPNY